MKPSEILQARFIYQEAIKAGCYAVPARLRYSENLFCGKMGVDVKAKSALEGRLIKP